MREQDSIIIINDTEQRINRPKRNQKRSYSGKKMSYIQNNANDKLLIINKLIRFYPKKL